MASPLKLLRVRVRTSQGWQEPYELDSAIVVVWGPIESGKTSLLDAIAFVFGRDVSFKGVVDHHLREVELVARIGAGTYTMTRVRKSKSVVTVLDAGGTLEGRFPVQKRDEDMTLSDWMAAQLHLDDALAAIRLPGNKGTLTFATGLLPFCYLPQDDIDRQIIMPAGADATRITVFKLLMNLTTAEYERKAGEIRDAENLLKRRREAATVITEFLNAQPATNLETLDTRIAELAERRKLAARRVEEAKSRSNAVEEQDRHYDQLISEASAQWERADDEYDKISRRNRRALDRVEELRHALRELDELEERPLWQQETIQQVVTHCSFCGGAVPRGPLAPGQCFMCGGLRRGVVQPAERNSLERALSDSLAELEQLEPQLREASVAVDEAKAFKHRLRRQRDERTRFPLPYLGAVADAEQEFGKIDGELNALRNSRASAARVLDMREHIDRLEREQRDRREQHVLHEEGLTSPDDLIFHLREIFVSIIEKIGLPHWTGRARIDSETFLPFIDGLAFDRRGGGARAVVSIAYSLALLTYALENPHQASLPTLLMIDSPRKNFGASASDQDLADRLYDQILDYLKRWSGLRSRGGEVPFQIIIVDNDRHADKNTGTQGRHDGVLYHHFSADHGFIRGLKNPHAIFVSEPSKFFDEGSADE